MVSIKSNFIIRGGADFSKIQEEIKKTQKATALFKSNIKRLLGGVQGDSNKVQRAMTNLSGGFGKSLSGIKARMKETQSAVSSFKSSLWKSMSKLGILLATVFSVKAGINLASGFMQSQEAVSKLAKVMQNTMNATKEQIESVISLTGLYQKMGAVSSGAQQAGLQELSTYLSSVSSAKKLLPVMNDMLAQQYGYNATAEQSVTIATMLGKVMNGQVGALSRYGYSFSDAQERILKYGTEAERAAVLAEVISESVGGMNKALGETPIGRIKQLQNNFGDLKDSVGQTLLTLFVPLTGILNRIINQMTAAFTLISQLLGKAFNVSFDIPVGLGGIAYEAEDATAAIDGIGSAVKKVKKSVAGFDDLNILSFGTTPDSDISSDMFNSGITSNVDDISDGVTVVGEFSEKLENIKNKIISLANNLGLLKPAKSFFNTLGQEAESLSNKITASSLRLKQGFVDMFKGISGAVKPLIQPIAEAFGHVGELSVVFFAGKIKSIIGIIESIIFNLQSVVTSGFHMIATVLSPIADSLNGFFRQNNEGMKSHFRETWQSIENTIVHFANSIGGFISGILDGYTEWFKGHYDEVKALFSNAWTAIWSIIDTSLQFISSAFHAVFGGIGDFISENSSGIKETIINTWNMVWSFLAPICNKIMEIVTLVFGKIKSYISEWAPIVREIISSTMGFIWEIIKKVLERIQDFWDKWGGTITAIVGGIMKHIKNIISLAVDFIGATISYFLSTIKNIINFALAVIRGDWQGAWDAIKNQIDSATAHINRVIGIFKNYFINVFDNIVTTAGDIWNNLWGGIKNSFDSYIQKIKDGITGFKDFFISAFENINNIASGIWQGLLSGIKTLTNSIIDIVNSMIDRLNRLQIKIPEVDVPLVGKMGGGAVGFNIPKIPHLAAGAVVPPNDEFLAVLGDNKRETEIVSPLSMIKSAVSEAMRETASLAQLGDREIIIKFTGDGADLASMLAPTIVQNINGIAVRRGVSVIKS